MVNNEFGKLKSPGFYTLLECLDAFVLYNFHVAFTIANNKTVTLAHLFSIVADLSVFSIKIKYKLTNKAVRSIPILKSNEPLTKKMEIKIDTQRDVIATTFVFFRTAFVFSNSFMCLPKYLFSKSK